jgi:hypothetical protein
MAYVMSIRGAGAGSTPSGGITGWQIDNVERTTAFASGYTIALSRTPFSADAIVLYSEYAPMPSGDNWTYDSGTNEITILFGANPATDTDDGIWHFQVQYPY